MSKILNSELLIKGKIWNNDSLELVDFSNYDTEKTEIRVQSSGTLSRIDKTITFTKGKNVGKTPFELLSINRNESNGSYRCIPFGKLTAAYNTYQSSRKTTLFDIGEFNEVYKKTDTYINVENLHNLENLSSSYYCSM